MNAPTAHASPPRLWAAGLPGCQALVVDGNPASRTVLSNMLRDFGVGQVTQTTRAQDARRLLEHRRFDIVVCEYHFERQSMTGQDLIDDLRLAHLLPLSTVVLMISSEAAYANVAEAAEAALDAYLLKPHTERSLREQIERAMQRKRQLGDIIDRVEHGALLEAAQMCQARSDARGPDWLSAARIGAELWLRLGRPHAAQPLFEAILSTRAVPWARLGLARSEYQTGGVRQARRTLESLLDDQPAYADAYDVMGRVLLDQGEPEAALAALRNASALTPGSVTRLQKLGLLAYYHGDAKEAFEILQRAATLGLNSRVFDLQGLMLLGFLQFDRGDARGLGQSLRTLSAARESQAGSARLRRFESTLAICKRLLDRQVAAAVQMTQQALGEVLAPDFEFEAACNLLSVLVRLAAREVKLDVAPERLAAMADRFAVSRTTCELLCRAVQGRPDFSRLIRDRYAAICEHAEAAVSHTVAGAPREAVVRLLDHAQQSLNGKLIDLALHTIERHHAGIDDADDLSRRAAGLHEKYRSYGAQVHLRRGTAPAASAT